MSEQTIEFTATICRPDGVDSVKLYAVRSGAIVNFSSTPVLITWGCCGAVRRLTKPQLHPSRHVAACRGRQ